MNASFGIDHPLLATHDIEALRSQLIAMGFNMTAIGKHPWGTSTTLAMFDGCLLEIMGIYDETLIDEVPAGDFRFGRHVYEHLQMREGVALTALHSTNSEDDARKAEIAGFDVAGHLEFGRNVVLPDGTTGRTKTTLALMPNAAFPRLSFFLCQQHRPDLIYVPEWLEHPNTVNGICGVNIVAAQDDHAELKSHFEGLYGDSLQIDRGISFKTANGTLRILEPQAFEDTIGKRPEAVSNDVKPFIAGMDFMSSDPDRLKQYLVSSGTAFEDKAGRITLLDPTAIANTTFRFFS
jgi:hypothetical protein